MPNDAPISRPAFDEAAARLRIAGTDAHMDELYSQLRGVLAGTQALKEIVVGNAEPDIAFVAAGAHTNG